MTQDQIHAIYDELGRLDIRLEQTPELGPEYLKDRLLECRQKQNRTTELIVLINRDYTRVRQACRAQETAVRIAAGTAQVSALREELAGFVDEREALRYLLEAVQVRRSNLMRTSTDIRLMVEMWAEQHRPAHANVPQERPVITATPLGPPTSVSSEEERAAFFDLTATARFSAIPVEPSPAFDAITAAIEKKKRELMTPDVAELSDVLGVPVDAINIEELFK